MSEYQTGRRSRLGADSFLYKPTWTTTGSNMYSSVFYMGERTGGSAYWCDAFGDRLPHIPLLGNEFHGVGATFNRPDGDKIYADNCIHCMTRIENRYSWDTLAWDGWRPTVTVPPKYVIEEVPYG